MPMRAVGGIDPAALIPAAAPETRSATDFTECTIPFHERGAKLVAKCEWTMAAHFFVLLVFAPSSTVWNSLAFIASAIF